MALTIDALRQVKEKLAYALWEESGKPGDMADHFWYEAEKHLKDVVDIDDQGDNCWQRFSYQPVIDPQSFNKPKGMKSYSKKLLEEGEKFYKRLKISNFRI
jgi:hypothetical protein